MFLWPQDMTFTDFATICFCINSLQRLLLCWQDGSEIFCIKRSEDLLIVKGKVNISTEFSATHVFNDRYTWNVLC